MAAATRAGPACVLPQRAVRAWGARTHRRRELQTRPIYFSPVSSLFLVF